MQDKMEEKIMIAPSIMCISEWHDTKNIFRQLKENGIAMIHADVMDGKFVPNLMLGTESIKHLREVTDIPLDIHMMVEKPEEKLDWFDIQPGEYVSVHAESTRHLQRTLAKIADYGAHPMVALNPATPLCMLEDVLDDVSGVLLMTVNPGFAGQKLVPQTLGKITRLRELLDKTGHEEVFIEVDGNVSFENALDGVLGANQIYKNEEGTEVNFDNDVYRAGLNLVKETLDKGYAIPIEDEFSEDISVANTFLQGKCAIMLGVAQMRLCMDQENYPHDFMTALVPAPVPDDEKYNTEFYRKQIGTTGAGDLLSISANTKYPEASFEFAMWYLKGGMSPLVQGGRIPLWNGVNKDEVLSVLKEKAQGSIDMDSMENYLSLDTTQGVAAIKGHASSEISSAWFEEFDAMCYGKQSVDQTVQNMEKRGNELIQTELSSQK